MAESDLFTTRPRVRVVVVDFDGGELTQRCVTSLLASGDDVDLEVVVVDNGSQIPVEQRITADDRVAVVRSSRNRGFAGGANLGMGDLQGLSAVALVNNDATVRPGWLMPLLAALASDPRIAAASPKIVFSGRYRALGLRAEHPIRLFDVLAPGAVRAETDVAAPSDLGSGRHWPIEATATFWVEDGVGDVALDLDAERPTKVAVAFGVSSSTVTASPERARAVVDPAGDAVVLVNNVGTAWRADGYGYDLGYLQVDDGRFDDASDIDAWSGGAVLLRAQHLREVGRFDEDLFLYYEDLDLALRGREAGGRFRLVPSSVVEHAHSATAVTGSSFAEYHKERNRLLVVLRHRGWLAALRATIGLVAHTWGYARRDIVRPLLGRGRPNGEIVAWRLRAARDAVVLASRFRPGRRPRAT